MKYVANAPRSFSSRARASARCTDMSTSRRQSRHGGWLTTEIGLLDAVIELKDRIIARRGTGARNIAKGRRGRKLLTCVFYALRDGQVRSLAARSRAQQAG
jgi:hypothetical protein